MELRARDDYRVECVDNISATELYSLSVLYAPILSSNAIKFYLFLVSEAMYANQRFTHQRICSILDMSIMEIENARFSLEEMLLMKTFYQHLSSVDHYVYQMKLPLLPNQFLDHNVFGRLYVHAVGKQQYEITKQLCAKVHEPIQNYTEVTKPFQNKFMMSWDDQNEEMFKALRPTMNNEKGTFDLPINFDYDEFLRDMSDLVLPISARSKQSLKIIGELATIYGISVDRMRMLAPYCLDPITKEISEEKLRARCRKEKGHKESFNEPRTKYDMAPVLFFRDFQNGIDVSAADSKLLEDLVRNMKLEPEVVNVLVEFILTNHEMRFDRRLVEKYATTWVRLKINTVEAALTYISSSQYNSSNTRSNKKEGIVPQWQKEMNEKSDSAKSDTPKDKEEMELQRKLYLQRVQGKEN